MKTIEEQTRTIDECITRYQYDFKEYFQKTEILKSFIEVLQALKIK